MREIIKKVYCYNELSNSAQQEAHRNYLSDFQLDWSGEYLDSIEKGLEAFGAKLTAWSLDFSCPSRSSWKIDMYYDDLEITGVRLRTWLLNRYANNLYERKGYGKYQQFERYGKKVWDYPRRSKISFVESDCPFTGFCADDEFLVPIREFIKKPCNHTTFEELLNSCVESVIHAAAQEYEHETSEEYFIELCEMNSYEFYENGEMV